ncbi:hypothetical protein GW17_00041711 [Ensete ventricosum]|nr:hypothetical protein GW17_00041711 [Ensete ventricosum]
MMAGGACGYGTLVDVKPLRARVGAVSPVLFKGGEGCGACYKVRCLDPAICSRRAVTVIITDECPGGYCAAGHTHFDLSGAAFGRMAVAGEAGQLRDRGEISVIFRSWFVFLVAGGYCACDSLCFREWESHGAVGCFAAPSSSAHLAVHRSLGVREAVLPPRLRPAALLASVGGDEDPGGMKEMRVAEESWRRWEL